jgi:hypothetical protein
MLVAAFPNLFTRSGSMGGRTLTRIVIGLIVGIGAAIYGFHKKDSAGTEVLERSREMIAQADIYKGNETTFDALLEAAHADAFDHAYHMGGRHTPDRFDEEQYESELFSVMIRQAAGDGQAKIAESLQRLQAGPDAPPAAPAKPAQKPNRQNPQQKPRR